MHGTHIGDNDRCLRRQDFLENLKHILQNFKKVSDMMYTPPHNVFLVSEFLQFFPKNGKSTVFLSSLFLTRIHGILRTPMSEKYTIVSLFYKHICSIESFIIRFCPNYVFLYFHTTITFNARMANEGNCIQF